MTITEANSYALQHSETGKDGMTVVKLGYVYSLINQIFDEHHLKFISDCHGCKYFDIFIKKKCFPCVRLPNEYKDDNFIDL